MSQLKDFSWFYEVSGTQAIIVAGDGDTVLLANVTENTAAHRELEANMRLIAASTLMLRTLVAVGHALHDPKTTDEEMERLRNIVSETVRRADATDVSLSELRTTLSCLPPYLVSAKESVEA